MPERNKTGYSPKKKQKQFCNPSKYQDPESQEKKTKDRGKKQTKKTPHLLNFPHVSSDSEEPW